MSVLEEEKPQLNLSAIRSPNLIHPIEEGISIICFVVMYGRHRQQNSHQRIIMRYLSQYNMSNTMHEKSKKIKWPIYKRKVLSFTKPKIIIYAFTLLVVLQQKQKYSFIASAVEDSLPLKEYSNPKMMQSERHQQLEKQRKLQQYEESGNFELDGLFGSGSNSDPSDVTDGIFDDDFYTTFVDDFFANTLTQSPTQRPSYCKFSYNF